MSRAYDLMICLMQEKKPECVKVIVRCRPMSKDEIADGYQRFEVGLTLVFVLKF